MIYLHDPCPHQTYLLHSKVVQSAAVRNRLNVVLCRTTVMTSHQRHIYSETTIEHFNQRSTFSTSDTWDSRLQTCRDTSGDNYTLAVCDCDLFTIVTRVTGHWNSFSFIKTESLWDINSSDLLYSCFNLLHLSLQPPSFS